MNVLSGDYDGALNERRHPEKLCVDVELLRIEATTENSRAHMCVPFG